MSEKDYLENKDVESDAMPAQKEGIVIPDNSKQDKPKKKGRPVKYNVGDLIRTEKAVTSDFGTIYPAGVWRVASVNADSLVIVDKKHPEIFGASVPKSDVTKTV